MKLKGWKKLGKTISKIGKEIDKKLTYKLSSIDQSDPYMKKVYFGILRDVDGDMLFLEHLYKTYPNAPKLSPYMYSLLHEIGHCHTKKVLSEEPNELRKKANETNDHNAYFALPSEVAATNWAVKYAKKHYSSLLLLEKRIDDAMSIFLVDNNFCE